MVGVVLFCCHAFPEDIACKMRDACRTHYRIGSVRILRNPTRAGRGDGAYRESLLPAGGAAQSRLQRVQCEIPTDPICEALRRDPARVPAGAVDIEQPALAAVVREALNVREGAHAASVARRLGTTASVDVQHWIGGQRVDSDAPLFKRGAMASGRAFGRETRAPDV